MSEEKRRRCVLLFTLVTVFGALAAGLSSSIFSNYYKDVFAITAFQRGILEIPRESPGILCMFVVAALGGLGDLTLGILAQLCMAIGLAVMGLLSPGYGVVMAALFCHSLGQHLFMPLEDSIGLSLAEEGRAGSTLGHFKKYSNLFAMVAGGAVFVGFRVQLFSFNTPIILPFVLAMLLYFVTAALLLVLRRELPNKVVQRAHRPVLRKKYLPYYIITFAYGCQKRIRIVFAPWLIIELFAMGADTLALLAIASRLVSSWTAPLLGRYLDRNGAKKALVLEMLCMGLSFAATGVLAGAVQSGAVSTGGGWVLPAFLGYIVCNIIDQFNMVHTFLLKGLAKDHPEEITESLSVGLSIDHIMAIFISPVLGWVWTGLGAEWVFYIAAATMLVQGIVSRLLKEPALPQKAVQKTA